MNIMGMPWTALLYTQAQRTHQTAWFVYGWLEREHVLNLNAYADWWMRASGVSAGPFKDCRRSLLTRHPRGEPKVSIHNGDRAESHRYRSPSRTEALS